MTLDPTFFMWLKFALQAFKLFLKIFGSDDEKEEARKNGFAPESD